MRGAVTIRRPLPVALRWRSFLDRSSAALQILALVRGGGALGLGGGDLSASGMHEALDGTEKGAASYRLGMALAHLLSQDLLGLREVQHVDPVLDADDLTLVAGRRRPDLVGYDIHDAWSVIEAKGRTGSPGADVVNGAKRQAENVDLVRNATGALVSPAARVASVTDLSATPLHVDSSIPQSKSQAILGRAGSTRWTKTDSFAATTRRSESWRRCLAVSRKTSRAAPRGSM